MHEAFDPLTEVRAERFRALVAELMPKIKRVSPELTDDQLRAAAELGLLSSTLAVAAWGAAAELMAEYRLADEELGKNAL